MAVAGCRDGHWHVNASKKTIASQRGHEHAVAPENALLAIIKIKHGERRFRALGRVVRCSGFRRHVRRYVARNIGGARTICGCYSRRSRIQTIDRLEPTIELIRLVRIALSAFFGVRKRASNEADFADVTIVLLRVVAVFMAACVGATIFCVVHLLAQSASTVQGF